MKEGWLCPKCGRVNAPFTPYCDCVNSDKTNEQLHNAIMNDVNGADSTKITSDETEVEIRGFKKGQTCYWFCPDNCQIFEAVVTEIRNDGCIEIKIRTSNPSFPQIKILDKTHIGVTLFKNITEVLEFKFIEPEE